MLKENTIAIAILLVAIFALLFKQNSETMTKLTSIEQSTERLLTSIEPAQPTQRAVPAPSLQQLNPQMAQQRTPFQPIVYQWPNESKSLAQSLTTVSLDHPQEWSQDPAESNWGKETDRLLGELEKGLEAFEKTIDSHDGRLDSLEAKIAQLELLCFTEKTSATATKPQSKTKSADFELLSVDEDSPEPAPPAPTPAAPIYIEQPQIVHYQSAPVYQSPPVYSFGSPLTYGSTGSHRMAAASPAYGFMGTNPQSFQPYPQSFQPYPQSFGQSPQFVTSRVVRRPVQQVRTTSYSPVLGTRLGSRVGNFFGQDCPGGVCPQ